MLFKVVDLARADPIIQLSFFRFVKAPAGLTARFVRFLSVTDYESTTVRIVGHDGTMKAETPEVTEGPETW